MSTRSFNCCSNASRALRQAISKSSSAPSIRLATTTFRSQPSAPLSYFQSSLSSRRAFHAAPSRRREQTPPAEPPPTDFGELDVLANTPIPSTSVDVCMYDGFGLNSGVTVTDGNGVLLVDGEVFNWRPWEAKGSMNLVNNKGQFELPAEAFALFDLLWPRPGKLNFLYADLCVSILDLCESQLTMNRSPDHWSWPIDHAPQPRYEETHI